ncbi:conjugal transfer protein [Enterococcus hirae]|nr:conjugal transfer protein [Enterococcus hirae]MBE8805074.1 conjugal transfer protein [Enterococcus hirae]
MKEGKEGRQVITTYQTTIHQDEDGNKVIIQNPTITATPEKSDYEPKKFESDVCCLFRRDFDNHFVFLPDGCTVMV